MLIPVTHYFYPASTVAKPNLELYIWRDMEFPQISKHLMMTE
jgi:hypothetical protein